METIDELSKRQKDEIAQQLENQQEAWIALKELHGGEIPVDVVQHWQRQARIDVIELEKRHVKEREAIPIYGKVLGVERELVTEIRGLHDTIENQIDLNKTQEELIAKMEQARIKNSQELSQGRKP